MPKASLPVDSVDLEKIDRYVYLCQKVNVCHNPQPEIACRRAAEWHKFYSIIGNLKVSRRRAVLVSNTIGLKAMTYGGERESPTKVEEDMLAVTKSDAAECFSV